MQLFSVKNIMLFAFAASMLFTIPACKSGKLDCPAYSDNPSPAGIPKGNKTKSGVFPPNMKR